MKCMPCDESPDPRCLLEAASRKLAAQLRREPTVPGDPEAPLQPYGAALRNDMAVELPRKHCDFSDCLWHGDDDLELLKYVAAVHHAAIDAVASTLPGGGPKANQQERRAAVYNEAIAVVVRGGAPLASYAIDRRCLRNYVEGLGDDAVESLICFSCARRFPHLSGRRVNEVRWISPLGRIEVGENSCDRFCGMARGDTENIFGLTSYLRRYGHTSDSAPDLTRHMHEFDDWRLAVQFGDGPLDILCCPEDHQCRNAECLQQRSCCPQCLLPLCRECEDSLHNPRGLEMPAAALTNDMMIFYAPRELYTMNVTVMEMICASVCLTSMICFTLEAKLRKESPFDSEVHMSRHRMGARGNATSFPLPWQDILAELHRQDGGSEVGEEEAAAPDLPWVGEEFSNFVSVLLKTSDSIFNSHCFWFACVLQHFASLVRLTRRWEVRCH